MKKYVLTLDIELIDDVEVLDTVTETEYYDSLAEAEAAAQKYLEEGAGEYNDGTAAVVKSAEVAPEPIEADYNY